MSDTRDSIDFDTLDELVQQLGDLHGTAELHGLGSGLLAAGKRFSRSGWLQALFDYGEFAKAPESTDGDRLFQLYREMLAALERGELDFAPLLPPEVADLSERVAALGQWCQGFLSGFGLGAGQFTGDPDLRETLTDLAAIAQVDSDPGDTEDEGEHDLFAIVEYVRLAAIDIFWQHRPDPAAATAPVANRNGQPATPADLFNRGKLH